jgi:DNA-binding PadR family transcriptional regulator
LDALAEAGYVDKFEVTARSNGYRLTETGRELLLARQKWEQAKVANVDEKQPGGTTLESDTTEPDETNETSKTESDDARSDESADDEDDDDILDDLMGEFDDL